MVDREAVLRKRIEADYETIDRANRVLWGPDTDGQGGLAALSSLQADVLDATYLRDLPWRGVAQAVGFCQRTCQTLRDAALHSIDEHGLLALAAVAVDA